MATRGVFASLIDSGWDRSGASPSFGLTRHWETERRLSGSW